MDTANPQPSPLVLGLDSGGSRTRVVVADLHGVVRGRAEGGGANPVALGLDAALKALRGTIAEALRGQDPAAVRYAELGLAGDELLRQTGPAEALGAVLRETGLRCPHEVVGDALVAFAAATTEADGCLLVSGTGSVAVRIRDRRIVDTAGGYGWLLGDPGSGHWLGAEAVRVAVDTLRGRARAPRLTALVCAALLGEPEPVVPCADAAERLLAALYARPELRLSVLAPQVVEAVRAGDPDAPSVLDRAAAHLDALLAELGPRAADEPVVLAGSCLAPQVLGDRLTALVADRGPALLLRAEDHAVGAAWLAAARLPGAEPHGLARMHRALTGAG